ncbi:MAG: hypothetical protein K2W85_14025 [Phycisphaerales bacterium]|nr:hypothetical protein [Phycisphaerales bacterium]
MNRESNTRLGVVAVACMVAGTSAAHAQLIGPVPPKGEPMPAATPSGPEASSPPPRDLSKADSEPPAPSIVDRDEAGAMKMLARGPEEEAVARYAFTEDRRAKVGRSMAARATEVDRLVIEKIDAVLKVEAMRDRVMNATEFGPLFAARDAVAALRSERLLDRLQRDGAITALQRARLDQAVGEYEKAMREHFEQLTGGDPSRQAVLNLRQTYVDATREPLAALDRLMTDLEREAANLPVGVGAPLAEPKRGVLISAAKTSRDALRTAFGGLSDEEKRAVLTFALTRRAANP